MEKKDKTLKSSSEREQNQLAGSAEREKIKGSQNLNVPNLRFPEFSGEWEKQSLGATCNVLMCKRILASQTNTEGGVPFYKIGTIGGIADAYISRELFETYRAKYNYPRKGEVMITCAGTVGKTMLFDGHDSYYQDSNIVWIDNPNNHIDNTFLYHFLSRVDWSRLNTTTIVRIYNDDLRQLRISYPSKAEQKKISDLLNLLDQRIETQRKIIEDLKKLKDAISSKFLFDSSWEEYRMSEISVLGRGRVISSTEIGRQVKPQYPVYSSQTSNDGIMGYLDDYDFNGEYITWTTDGANAGTVFYRNGKFNCTNVCGTIKVQKNIDAYFLSVVLQSATAKYVSVNLANPKLMNNTMASIKVKLPNINIQKYWSQILRRIDDSIEVEGKYLNLTIQQKTFLLSHLFI